MIQPIALPSGNQVSQNFVGEIAIASGFGRTADGKICLFFSLVLIFHQMYDTLLTDVAY